MPEPSQRQELSSEWLTAVAKDTAKLGILLYLSGLLSFCWYYSRFRILTIDLARPEAVLIGFYIALLFVAVPWAAQTLFRRFRSSRRIGSMLGVFLALDWLLLSGFQERTWKIGIVAVLTAALQYAIGWVLLLRNPRESLVQRGVFIAVLVICCIDFSNFWLPNVPAYYGGGKPYEVQVFTKTENLADNRFFANKNRPQLNKFIDSYTLKLLYETDKDLYFIDEEQDSGTTVGYSVMRLKRDEVLRVNYETPVWTRW